MKVEEISRYLVERRKTLAISQQELAEYCGVSVHALSNLESGKGNPTLGLLLKVADVMGLKVTVGV